MFRLPSQLRATGSDVHRSAPAAENAISEGTTTLAKGAEEAAVRATKFRDDQQITLEATAARRQHAVVLKRRLDIARQLLELEKELDADPELREIYDALDSEDFTLSKFKR